VRPLMSIAIAVAGLAGAVLVSRLRSSRRSAPAGLAPKAR